MTTATEMTPDLSSSPPASPNQQEGLAAHPLIYAGRGLAADMLSTLFFVALFALTHNVYLATSLAIAVGLAQVAWLTVRRRPIDAMQWMSLGLVVVFGGASLVTHDPRFIMFKPTLIYVVVGAVMLRRGWMTRYMPPAALPWSGDVTTVFGYIWAAMMFTTGAINLALVLGGDSKSWIWFIGVFPLASKLTLFAVQYVTTRFIVIARRRAATPSHA